LFLVFFFAFLSSGGTLIGMEYSGFVIWSSENLKEKEETSFIKGNNLEVNLDYSFLHFKQQLKELFADSPHSSKFSSPKDSSFFGQADLNLFWQNPIYIINIKTLGIDSKIIKKLNAKITNAILQKYEDVLKSPKSQKEPQNEWDFGNEQIKRKNRYNNTGSNQLFMDWQRDGGWKDIMSSVKEIKKLFEFFDGSVDAFLVLLGLQEVMKNRSHEIEPWATVNHGCVYAPPRVYPGSLISGIYHVQVPPRYGKHHFRK